MTLWGLGCRDGSYIYSSYFKVPIRKLAIPGIQKYARPESSDITSISRKRVSRSSLSEIELAFHRVQVIRWSIQRAMKKCVAVDR